MVEFQRLVGPVELIPKDFRQLQASIAATLFTTSTPPGTEPAIMAQMAASHAEIILCACGIEEAEIVKRNADDSGK